jgi:hypothetical protein
VMITDRGKSYDAEEVTVQVVRTATEAEKAQQCGDDGSVRHR